MPRVSRKGLIRQCDQLFSKLVRARSEYVCERCGKGYPANSMGLHCSHHFSRRHLSIRFDRNNASAHCFSCHSFLGGNPYDFAIWIRGKLGDAAVEILREKRDSCLKITASDLQDIRDHLKEQWEWMQEQRASGVTGYLEFESPQ